MRRIYTLTLIFALICIPALASATFTEMGNYCSAPPFVTRSIAPNVLILMDNSIDMLNAAHGSTYSPNANKDNYMGYFKPQACYKYNSPAFEEVLNGSVSYTASDTCPTTAPFRGNLLNWATMSRYDILQKVLIGGNAVSKQGNAHTLLSIGGAWEKTYNNGTSNCKFKVNNGSLTIEDVTASSCKLLDSTPTPLAFLNIPWLDSAWNWLINSARSVYLALSGGARFMVVSAGTVVDQVSGVISAWAAQLTVTNITALNGQENQAFSITLEAGGNNNCFYNWTTSAKPSWLTTGPTYQTSGQRTNYRATWSGTPATAATYNLTVTVGNNKGDTPVTRTFPIVISVAPLQITTTSPITDAIVDTAYSFTLTSSGGTGTKTWSATGLPSWLTLNSSTGVLSGTPTATASADDFSVTVTDGAGSTVTKSLSITVKTAAAAGIRSSNYNVKVILLEETFTDLNGNGIWDSGETYTDSNGNGVWEGKQGIFQKFWDDNRPRARWGLMKFGASGGVVTVEADSCIPSSPASAFYTRIQNALPTDSSPLAQGLYAALDYFQFDGSPDYYKGCSSSDPIDSLPCRKNFVLVLSSGKDVGPASGYNFSQSDCTVPNSNNTAPLVQNACYGFKNDQRPTSPSGTQNVYTYVVNTMGNYNNGILEDAAKAGGGKYYDASSSSNLESQLTQAFTDILAQAASGTAVSVLTTSSRGVGSMVQAYFLPTRQDGLRDVWWTGYLQNLWIDPQDNLREDTTSDYQLILDTLTRTDGDKILKLFFDTEINETKAGLFNSGSDGIQTFASCTTATIKPFSDVKYIWEAGKKLAIRPPSERTIKTSTTVLRFSGNTTARTHVTVNEFTEANVTGNLTGYMATALNGSTTSSDSYYVGKITQYVRGECLETSGGGNNCTGTVDSTYRDRRLTVDSALKVWKLGDIISSTPKVLGGGPVNSYHIDYNDNSYYQHISEDAYKKRTSVAFVGANDGMLHAFQVGYLKDTGLSAWIKALFQNTNSDSGNTDLGKELWAFIPYNAFPYLKYMMDPGYCHLYYNDMSVRLVDASIGSIDQTLTVTDTTHKDNWRTILIGSMRFGGGVAGADANPTPPAGAPSGVGYSVYYALDVTNATTPVPLWEFSDADLGYTTGYPSIVRTGAANTNGNWYVAFGTGSKVMPKGGTDVGRTSTGYVYFLDLKTGNLVKKIGLPDNANVGDILSVDAEKDYRPERLYFGTYYKSGTTWAGKLMELLLPSDLTTLCGNNREQSAADCGSSLLTLFEGNYPFTASPDAVKDGDGNIWVYAGSGKYFSDQDEADVSAQVFIGVKDLAHTTHIGSGTYLLVDRSSETVTGTVATTEQVCAYNATLRDFSNQTIVTSVNITSTIPDIPANGWYVTLPNSGEKMISRPLAVGGVVDFLTYKPSSDPCSYGGDSYLYALDYLRGIAPSVVAIRGPGATSGTTDTVTVYRSIALGRGAPPIGEAIIIPPPKEGQEQLKKKIQVATGVIVEAVNQPAISVISKFLHWLRK